MVTLDTGLPDPDHPNEDLRLSNENVIVVTDDDSDQEAETGTLDSLQDEYRDYQPLPTFPNEDVDTVSDEDTDAESDINNIRISSNVSPEGAVPSIASMESTLVKEVWSGPPPKFCDIKMDSTKVDEVKQAMLNITLPASAIPDWAANIPEEEWKQQLIKRLENIENKTKTDM